VQLSEYAEKFTQLGVNLASVSYDTEADLKKYHQRHNLPYSLLQDKDSALIKALGILNTGPRPGDSAYGIPYPGIFLVDRNGIIRAKFAEQSFRDRPSYDTVLKAAEDLNQ
jgi:peroxiredoxin